MPIPWRKVPEGVRLFYIECECGEEFKAYVEVDESASPPPTGLLVPVSGECPGCGLELSSIDPPGDRSRA